MKSGQSASSSSIGSSPPSSLSSSPPSSSLNITSSWEEQLRERAKKKASRKVANMLYDEAQLLNTGSLKLKIQQQMKGKHAQLKSLIDTQLLEAKGATELLGNSAKLIGSMKSKFDDVNKLCNESNQLIEDYDTIRLIDIVRNNLLTTLTEAHRFIGIPQKIEGIKELLQQEINILRAFQEVKSLQKMKEVAEQKLSKGNDVSSARIFEEREVFRLSFQGVDDIIQQFEKKLFGMAGQVISLAMKHPAILIKIITVIELQEKYDGELRVNGVDEEKEAHRFGKYREKFFLALQSAIYAKFEEKLNRETVPKTLEAASKLLDDLTDILDLAIPCFPISYNIFEFFVHSYHLQFNTLMLKYSSTQVAPADLIEIIKWIRNIYNPALARLGIPDPQPPLLEAIEPLYSVWTNYIRGIMTSWVDNIVKLDLEYEPELINHVYVTNGPTDLFQGIDQQILVSFATGDEKFIYNVIIECGAILVYYQKCILNIIPREDLKFEYILAQINNNSRAYDQVEELMGKFSSWVRPETEAQLTPIFQNIADGFHSVAKTSTSILVDKIFLDLKEAISELFQSQHYEKNLVSSIMATFADYFENGIRDSIYENYFKILSTMCLQKFANSYLEQLFVKKHVIDSKIIQKIEQDIEVIRHCFENYLRKNSLTSTLKILEDLKDLLEAPPDSVALYYHAILNNHPDFTLNFVEHLLSMRTDLNKEDFKNAMKECEAVIANRQKNPTNNNANAKPGLFSKIKIKKNKEKK